MERGPVQKEEANPGLNFGLKVVYVGLAVDDVRMALSLSSHIDLNMHRKQLTLLHGTEKDVANLS